jgi:bifunctional UDP-N-acetylglucosamine pyrophosphorylase/glucosamine-1-phosphate N-acetyltransferase
LIRTETLKGLIRSHIANASSATVLTAVLDNASGYGRIIRGAEGRVEKIVEQKDASAAEAAVNEVNTGTYCFNTDDLYSALAQVGTNNAQKEYYLTDVIGILNKKGKRVFAHRAREPKETLGVNTLEDLARLEAAFTDAV